MEWVLWGYRWDKWAKIRAHVVSLVCLQMLMVGGCQFSFDRHLNKRPFCADLKLLRNKVPFPLNSKMVNQGSQNFDISL